MEPDLYQDTKVCYSQLEIYTYLISSYEDNETLCRHSTTTSLASLSVEFGAQSRRYSLESLNTIDIQDLYVASLESGACISLLRIYKDGIETRSRANLKPVVTDCQVDHFVFAE